MVELSQSELPLGPVNVELLQRIKQHILQEPKRLQMNIWRNRFSGTNAPSCGTIACIAGWAVELGDPNMLLPERTVLDRALELLGLTNDVREYAQLFCVRYWREPWKTAYANAWENQERKVQVTASYLDFICGLKTAQDGV